MSAVLATSNCVQLHCPSFDDNDERVSALISTANTWDPANLLILISYRVTRVCLSCSTLARPSLELALGLAWRANGLGKDHRKVNHVVALQLAITAIRKKEGNT